MAQLKRFGMAIAFPLIGVTFIILWIIAAATTISAEVPLEWIPYALIGVSIGIARVSPPWAVVAMASVIAVQVAVPGLRFGDRGWPAYLGLLVVILVVAASRNVRAGMAALIVGACGAALLGLLVATVDMRIEWVVIFGLVTVGAAWAAGSAIRLYRQRNTAARRSHELQDEVAANSIELAVALERDRTAQDVHDIMAHSLSVIVAQADGALYKGRETPEVAAQSLVAIARAGREALAELRILLDSLTSTPEGHSHPTLEDLETLLTRMREAGLYVTDDIYGAPGTLTAGQQLAVYRILQESLTNALKHSGANAAVRITRDWRGTGLALTVTSTGELPVGVQHAQRGRGITGMTERARLAGGWLAAESDSDDPRQFVVTAFMPAQAAPTAVELIP